MNPRLLLIDSSARLARSVTRRLTTRYADAWLRARPDGVVVRRDLGLAPPPAIDEAWISAAFIAPAEQGSATRVALALSETLIEEIAGADQLVIGAPLYNFGMPASLKAWCDQIIRIDRTFALTDDPFAPYRPLLAAKPVLVVTSAGSDAFLPGGAQAELNHLENHLATMLDFIGLQAPVFVRVGNAELKDEAYHRSLALAEAELDALARLAV